jgi:hypothetical protein
MTWRKLPVYNFLMVACVVFVSGGCRIPNGKSDVKYGVIRDSDKVSMLVDIDRTGEMPICILARIPTAVKSLGISETAISKRIAEVREFAETSAKTWLGFLSNNPSWHRKDVRIKFYLGEKECQQKPWWALTIFTDVGPARSHLVPGKDLDPDCVNFVFKEPDGRQCLPESNPNTRSLSLASAGYSGGLRSVAHELGHIFGLADTYDQKDYQEGFYARNEASIMGKSENFHVDDSTGINGIWSYINGGLPCIEESVLNKDAKGRFGALHCATKRNRVPKKDRDGKLSCDKGYRLSRVQICIAGFDEGTFKPPTCPSNMPDYDTTYGVCCPAGQGFDLSQMGCAAK